jgi:hypothetical protein
VSEFETYEFPPVPIVYFQRLNLYLAAYMPKHKKSEFSPKILVFLDVN